MIDITLQPLAAVFVIALVFQLIAITPIVGGGQ